MAAAAGALLFALTFAASLINLYFTTLILGVAPGLRRRLAALFNACGAETSSCAIVVQSPYARMFGGAPNVAVGILWNLALLALAVRWIATAEATVPWPYLVVAAGSLAVAAYLIHALVVVLEQPCPL